MSYDLILPYFPKEIQALLLDPTISDLMVNGTRGVFADRAGKVEKIELSDPTPTNALPLQSREWRECLDRI